MDPLVQRLSDKLLPEFTQVVDKIRETMPSVSALVYDRKHGGQFFGHSFFIDLSIRDCLSEVDNAALVVSIYDLDSLPKIHAYVCWGHPSGYCEAEFSETNLKIPDKVLEDFYNDLPRLYEALFAAVKRRKPPDE